MSDEGFRVDTMGLRVVALLSKLGMREGEVVQSGDGPEMEGQGGGGLAVGRVENAVLGRVPVGVHAYVESALNRGNGSFDEHIHAIAGSAKDGKVVHLREVKHRVILFLAGTKPFGELRHCEVLAVVEAVRIVELFKKTSQPGLVAQGQNNVEGHDLASGKPTDELRLATANGLAHMMG